MKLFEYQAKEIYSRFGIPIPNGVLIVDANEIAGIGGDFKHNCVLKSQILTGGRGKAGLIQFASNSQDRDEKAVMLFEKSNVNKILIEEKLDIDEELYLAITVDPIKAKILFMACAEGGIDIEELAVTQPKKIVREYVDSVLGLMPYQIRNILFALGLKGEQFKQGYKIIQSLYTVFSKHDAELAEINPLVTTTDGRLIAADGKLILDDNAVFRQESFELTREGFDNDLEFEAAQRGIPYLLFDGDIGLMCAGAGLTNTVYDLINDYGGSISNYLEFGGPNYRRAVEAMELTLKSNPKVVLIVTFGTIARADVMAEGIAKAKEKLCPTVPIVTAIRGTGEEKAGEILREIGLETLSETEDAVQRAVEIVRGGAK